MLIAVVAFAAVAAVPVAGAIPWQTVTPVTVSREPRHRRPPHVVHAQPAQPRGSRHGRLGTALRDRAGQRAAPPRLRGLGRDGVPTTTAGQLVRVAADAGQDEHDGVQDMVHRHLPRQRAGDRALHAAPRHTCARDRDPAADDRALQLQGAPPRADRSGAPTDRKRRTAAAAAITSIRLAMDYELPDGTTLTLDDGATGADAAAAIGAGLARAALAIKVDGELRDLARPLPTDGNGAAPKLEILTDRSGEEALAADPPRRRARARRGRDRALSGREDLDRAADRERLLLRLRVPRRGHRQRRRLPERSRRRCRRTSTPTSRSCARTSPSRRRSQRFRERAAALQGRADRGPGHATQTRPPTRVALHQRPLHRPVPRPACAEHQAHQGVQAAVGRRRLLARRRQPPDAHARVWDGVLLRQGSRRRTWSGSSARAPTTTAGSAPSSACSRFSELAPGIGVLVPGRARSCSTSSSALSREMGKPRGYTEVKTPQLYDSALWKTSGHWEKYRENMFVTESEDRRWRSSR